MAALRLRLTTHLQQLCLLLIIVVVISPCCHALTWGKCSTTCESKFCKEAPVLRYGKYCGLFYTGCPGEDPCDGMDSCCMAHDDCIGHSNYLNVTCNQALLDCVDDYQNSGDGQFPGNTCDIADVEHTIHVAIQAAVWIGDGIGDGPPSPSPPPLFSTQHQIHVNQTILNTTHHV